MIRLNKRKKIDPKKLRYYRILTLGFWIFFLGMVLTPIFFFFLAKWEYLGPLPEYEQIANPKNNFATEVYSADGEVLGYYYVQNRSQVKYEDISPHVINALIATEDTRFYKHAGIDFFRTFSIIVYNLLGYKQGASTISQQLALNLFSKRETDFYKRVIQKFKEWVVAIELEKLFSKKEIITLYLNTVDFGYSSFGIQTAARTFFNTQPKDLNIYQSATLVGLLKATGFYSPIFNPERSIVRRNLVMSLMKDKGFIDENQYILNIAQPLGTDINIASHNKGLAPYFRSVLTQKLKKIIKEKKLRKLDGSLYNIYRDGLKIYTTLDAKMQQHAETAQKEYLTDLQQQFDKEWKYSSDKFLGIDTLLEQTIRSTDRFKTAYKNGLGFDEIYDEFFIPRKMKIFTWDGPKDTVLTAIDSLKYHRSVVRNSLVSIDPSSGAIKVWVGGVDHNFFKFDQVSYSRRQVGSTAKPFTYAVALQNGFEPCTEIRNESVTIDGWSPRADGHRKGLISLKNALAHSENFITANLMKQLHPKPIAEFIRRLDINSFIPEVPSICLGTFDASLLEMTSAYSTFANNGLLREPFFIDKIENKYGKVLYRGISTTKRVMEKNNANFMLNMLQQVIKQGTGRRLRFEYLFANPIAGKTGTTQKNSDGWFIGIIPSLITGVWTGFEERTIRFRTTRLGQGANSALPVFARFLKKIYNDIELPYNPNDKFKQQNDFVSMVTNCPPDAYYRTHVNRNSHFKTLINKSKKKTTKQQLEEIEALLEEQYDELELDNSNFNGLNPNFDSSSNDTDDFQFIDSQNTSPTLEDSNNLLP